MAKRFEADGDTWEVALEAHSPQKGVNSVVFHCVSNPQRAYRVLPLDTEVGRAEHLPDGASSDRLRELFERSQSMGYTLDAEADPRNTSPRTEPS